MADKKTNYNQKEKTELIKILKDKEKDLLEAKVAMAQRKTKDVHLPSKIRHEIAKVKTALHAKSLGV
ncbi:MAG: 50S ribosomal protein L29 [Candidatus Woykebacteria bacterium GWB1_45_5]|uniref:Large ribosomal subunit protein uL29 n=2 Tax=Candidatus Woykeibacteriota TaxID=1817899 RepID=A0A1G1W2M5_9BACT|nr:MAG: 50S ribosomal protein L29 [Candidatus Woykebacteria bacterium GWA1_44_8]OGY23325.1 MAG: 50S ribosomal protein L29 [Candidatus Woykebacteria bacterium GWB1_45_5]